MQNNVELKNRELNVGDTAFFRSVVVNGTGATECFVVIDKIVDKENKIYHVTNPENKNIDWTVQDIDEEKEIKKVGKNQVVCLGWLVKI